MVELLMRKVKAFGAMYRNMQWNEQKQTAGKVEGVGAQHVLKPFNIQVQNGGSFIKPIHPFEPKFTLMFF